jgi:sugar lactone lactonase YvrE
MRKPWIERGVGSLTFSPDGSLFATGSLGTGLITLWNAVSGECVGQLQGHTYHVEGMTFVDEGRTLVSASYDQTIRVWDLESLETTAILDGSLGKLTCVCSAKDVDHVITTAWDGTVARWPLALPPKRSYPTIHPGITRFVCFTGNESELIGMNEHGGVVIADGYDPESVKPVELLGEGNESVAWCAEKRLLAAENPIDKRIRVWSREDDDVKSLPNETGLRTLRFLDGGRVLLAVNFQRELATWDTETWERADERALSWRKILDDFSQHILPRYNDVDVITVSPDEQLVGVGTWSGGVVWYDLKDGGRLEIDRAHRSYVNGLAFSQDGTLPASTSSGGQVALWKTGAQSPSRVAIFRASRGSVRSPSFSPDGSRLVTNDGERALKVWDVATQRQLLTLPCELGSGRGKSVFFPDGNGLLTAGMAGLHVWRVPSFEDIAESE